MPELDPVIADGAGLLGVVLYVLACALLQFGWIKGQTIVYAGLNLLAAGLVLASLASEFNRASALIQGFWIAISLGGIARLLLIRRRLRFGPEEAAFLAAKLPLLTRAQARRVLDRAVWLDAPAGMTLTCEGVPVPALVYIVEGGAEVALDGHEIGRVGPGALIGEVTCLQGEPATTTVRLAAPSRILAIDAAKLRALAARDELLSAALAVAFARDVRVKLQSSNDSLVAERRLAVA